MALKISLKPGERFVVNGAVITNGDRRSAFIIQNKVSILRERDILRPEEVNTPARRIYFPIMLCYLEPENAGRYRDEFVLRMGEFLGVIVNPAIQAICVEISMQVMDGDYYKALANCRKLLDYETEKLAPFTVAA